MNRLHINSPRLPKSSSFLNRSLWLKIHLWIALSFGFLLALLGLTGSVCVYQTELDHLLNPHLTITKSQAAYQSFDKIMAALQVAHPQRSGSWTLELPRTENDVITAWFDKPRETFFEAYAPLMVAINPYTAEIISSRLWGRTLATWLLKLHSELLLDGSGSTFVGILGIFMCISLGSGVYLWWPGLGKIKQAFQLRTNQGVMRLCQDAHRWLGLLSSFALLPLAITGVLLSYPQLSETLFGAAGMEHGQTGKTIISTADPNDHPTSLSGAVFIARAPFPKATLRRITTPVGDTGVYQINLKQGDEINQRHPYTTVWIDRWSGQIKEVRNPQKFSFRQTLNTWIWPLHTGEMLGSSGRILWFLAGQALFWIYISGLAFWGFRTGKLKDLPINYSQLRRKLNDLKRFSYRIVSQTRTKLLDYVRYCIKIMPIIQKFTYRYWRQFEITIRSLKR